MRFDAQKQHFQLNNTLNKKKQRKKRKETKQNNESKIDSAQSYFCVIVFSKRQSNI